MYNPDHDLQEIIAAIESLNYKLPIYIARDGIEKQVIIKIYEDIHGKQLEYKFTGMWPSKYEVERKILKVLQDKSERLGLKLTQAL